MLIWFHRDSQVVYITAMSKIIACNLQSASFDLIKSYLHNSTAATTPFVNF